MIVDRAKLIIATNFAQKSQQNLLIARITSNTWTIVPFTGNMIVRNVLL